jgi:hypothetical protein
MDIMELHQLVGLCRNEPDAFEYLFQKKRADRKFLSALQGQGILFHEFGKIEMQQFAICHELHIL